MPKGYFRGSKKCIFLFWTGTFGKHIHICGVQHPLLIESYISFIRWDYEIAFFFKMGIHQCGVWFKDLPRFDNCQKHVRCILPLENCILLTFERDTGEYYTFYERGILYLLKGVYYNPERGILYLLRGVYYNTERGILYHLRGVYYNPERGIL